MISSAEKTAYLNALDLIFSAPNYSQKLDSHFQTIAAIYNKYSGLEMAEENAAMQVTAQGNVPLPQHAAACFNDYLRTYTFLKGIYHAIEERLALKQPISILYAGCGPFATLLTPTLSLLLAEKGISVYLLDFHQESLTAALRLYKALGLDTLLQDCIQANAVDYSFNALIQFDIIISETMQAALRAENQVSIMRNLIHCLKDDGIFIPQEVNIRATLNTGSKEMDLGEIYILNYRQLPPENFKKSLTLPPIESESFLILETQIKVHEQFLLNSHDSGLTTPIILDKLNASGFARKICLSYEEKPFPGFKLKYLL